MQAQHCSLLHVFRSDLCITSLLAASGRSLSKADASYTESYSYWHAAVSVRTKHFAVQESKAGEFAAMVQAMRVYVTIDGSSDCPTDFLPVGICHYQSMNTVSSFCAFACCPAAVHYCFFAAL